MTKVLSSAVAHFQSGALAHNWHRSHGPTPSRALAVPGRSSLDHIVTPTTSNATRTDKTAGRVRKPAKTVTRAMSIALVRDEEYIVSSAIAATGPHLEIAATPQPAFGLKRAFDIAAALIALTLVSPLIALIAIAIKLESRGPIFFAHRRLGKSGRIFRCWKFRSMHADAESRLRADASLRRQYVSNHFKIPQHLDPRITRLGHFLRRSSLDELPQLWNVLWGEMSLVGPRPIVPLESTHYGDELPLLLSVRPGITGAWAVHGRSSVGYPHRAKIELEYVRSWSFTADLSILARTPSAVFTQRGAH
jgi:Sugar transferases involved in lipopolysaccharide synthesis